MPKIAISNNAVAAFHEKLELFSNFKITKLPYDENYYIRNLMCYLCMAYLPSTSNLFNAKNFVRNKFKIQNATPTFFQTAQNSNNSIDNNID